MLQVLRRRSQLTCPLSSLLYHSILISLNRHFVRPTSGFAANKVSKEICVESAATIVALIRQFRTQQGLGRSPVLVVYSAVMAGSAIFFTQDSTALALEKDTRLSFIMKALEECSNTHNLAKEALIKLRANIDARRAVAADGGILTAELDLSIDQQPDLMDIPAMSWMDGSMFDLGAFDLGAFGSFDPMAFRDMEGNLSQGLMTFPNSGNSPEDWLTNDPSMSFQSTLSNQYPTSTQNFDLHNFGAAEQ